MKREVYSSAGINNTQGDLHGGCPVGFTPIVGVYVCVTTDIRSVP